MGDVLIDWQRHNEGRKISKKKFSSLVGKETKSEIIVNGFKKAGITPFDPNVVAKEQYDPLSYKRWEKHQHTNDTEFDPDDNNDQPGCSTEGAHNKETTRSFEELLLSTVKQTAAPSVTRKRKVGTGAEVITSDEVYRRLKEKDIQMNLKSSTAKKKKGKSAKTSNRELNDVGMESDEDCSGEEILLNDSDDDV